MVSIPSARMSGTTFGTIVARNLKSAIAALAVVTLLLLVTHTKAV